jgi:hypothetical protein
MPYPYGVLPHELIEIIDNDRIIPGISYIYKIGEDFPQLNQYNQLNFSSNNNDTEENVNGQQMALLFDSLNGAISSKRSNLYKFITGYKRN